MAEIIAHRGASGIAPENTLPAFHLALAEGAQGIEIDVHLTADGVPVVLHDPTLDRVSRLSGPIAERTWPELRGLRTASPRFDGRYPGARLITLAEALAALPPPARFVVELKEGAEPRALVAAAVEAIHQTEARERTRIISFSPAICAEAHRHDPVIALGFLDGKDPARLLRLATEVHADWAHVYWRLITPAWLAAARRLGFRVNAWTVNDAGAARRLADLRVDEITTDWPARLRAALVRA